MAGASIFNVYGFLALDALIQFDPFQFVVEIAGMLAVRSGVERALRDPPRADAVGVRRRGTPRARARSRSASSSRSPSASISTSRWARRSRRRCRRSRCIDVLIAGAQRRRGTGARAAAQRILAAGQPPRDLRRTGRWSCIRPARSTVSQKIVPLNLPITRVGAREVDGGTHLQHHRGARSARPSPTPTPVRDQFAPAQFIDMSDAEKLSRPSFEQLEAGVQAMRRRCAAHRLHAGARARLRGDLHPRSPGPRFSSGSPRRCSDALRHGAARRRSRRSRRSSRFKASQLATPPVGVELERLRRRRRPRTCSCTRPTLVFESQAEAAAAQAGLVAADPKLAGTLQVLRTFELRAA